MNNHPTYKLAFLCCASLLIGCRSLMHQGDPAKPVIKEPIERVFPDVGWPKTIKGTYVTPTSLHGKHLYRIDPFLRPEEHRNHYNERNGNPITYLILHYTHCNFARTIDLFTVNTNEGRVSAHYVITQKEADHHLTGGQVIQVVPEDKNAWHAGISAWGSDRNLNFRSLGIEHVNGGFRESGGKRVWIPYEADQIRVSAALSQSIVKTYDLPPKGVLGHSDIAPTRKQDPGPLFPWKELSLKYKVGAWVEPDERHPKRVREKYDYESADPQPQEPNMQVFLQSLKKYGYVFNKDKNDGKKEDKEVAKIFNEIVNKKDFHLNKDWEMIKGIAIPVIEAFKAHFSANQDLRHYEAPTITQHDMNFIWGLNAKYPPDAHLDEAIA